MGKRKITTGLSEKEIAGAIKQLTDYEKDLLKKTELLRKRIAERIAQEAQTDFNGAIVDDLIKGGRRYAQVEVRAEDRDSITVVIADGKDAVWVEFGAGVYHNGSIGISPHPYGAQMGMIIGGYGKGNGEKETWGFYENGELRLTHGTPAIMPMAVAVSTVCDEISKLAQEVFK